MPFDVQPWADLPVKTTPIVAARLTRIEQGIADAQTAAAAAQATADAAAGSVGGAGTVIPGLVCDGVTDDGPAIQAALDAVEDGEGSAHLLIHGKPGSKCYINSTVTISASGTILDADVEILMGADARIRPWGVIEEEPQSSTEKPALVQDAAAGSTVLRVDQIPASWVAGIYIGLRGKRTASGSVPNEEIFHSYVASIDRLSTPKAITLVDPLPKAFLAVNDTPFPNKKSQVTVVVQSRLTGTPTAGNTVLLVETASIFAKGDVVRISDDVHTIDGDGTIRDGNFAHRETAMIVEIIDATTMKLSQPLAHTLVLAENARVEKLNVLRDVELRHFRMSWSAQQADGQHAIEIRYGLNVFVDGFTALGGGDGGVSWSGHAGRTTDSLQCGFRNGIIMTPSLMEAGRGYGLTSYGSTGTVMENVHVIGCRHSFLGFNGANATKIRNFSSSDARISDVDFHGAEEAGNMAIGGLIQGGTRRTSDSEGNRVALKMGNPSQTNGAQRNVVQDCVVIDYHGAVLEVLPRSSSTLVQGLTVLGATTGIKLVGTPDNAALTVSGVSIRNSTFADVRAPLQVDGGPQKAISGLALDGVTLTRCGPLQLINAPGTRLHRVVIEDPTSAGWQIMAWGSDGIRITQCDLSRTGKGIALTSCPNARVVHNVLHDMTGPHLHDGGGNTGMLFRSNEIHPGTGSYTRTGAASSSTTLQAGLADAGTESIGAATTGTTWSDPEALLGIQGNVTPGSSG